jgi:hypothetical protein
MADYEFLRPFIRSGYNTLEVNHYDILLWAIFINTSFRGFVQNDY